MLHEQIEAASFKYYYKNSQRDLKRYIAIRDDDCVVFESCICSAYVFVVNEGLQYTTRLSCI
jgi:hypothetical protein